MTTVETKTRERPILFSGPMVRALLAGTKTQTRRVVKWTPQTSGLPKTHLHDFSRAWVDGRPQSGQYLHVPYAHPEDGWAKNPDEDASQRVYATWDVGDRLWVRETFYRVPTNAFGKSAGIINPRDPHYMAIHKATWDRSAGWHWKPSIHMPRWACRLTLEVTEVRVERLQEITHHDALAEGVAYDVSKPDGSPLARFQQLWESINGAGSWVLNPWVWVVSFKTIEGGAR